VSPARRQAGFSLIELIVALLVAVILLAVALPLFWRAYNSYQLTNAARQMADILRLTRYEAIRLNKPVNCVIQPSATYPGMTNVWADSNGNNALDPTEKMVLLGNAGNLVDGSTVPGTATMLSQSNIGSMATNAPSATGSSVTFDQRGAVNPPTSVNVFYLSSAGAPDAGYRSVLLMPAGSIQIWSGDTSGNWQELR
jgi:prepilin-type N-terminal cleavage/methylation domain-containing protein